MKRVIEAFTDGIFDLCIIGGGITGAGAALDAASRGWRVALIDQADFASGTQSLPPNSSTAVCAISNLDTSYSFTRPCTNAACFFATRRIWCGPFHSSCRSTAASACRHGNGVSA